MAETKKEQLTDILQGLRKIGGIKSSAVISRDGLMVAADLSKNVDADTFAAMSAAMQGAAETAINELRQGELRQIVIESTKGKMVSIGAGKNAIVVILTEQDINLGLVLLEMGKASGRIAEIIEGQ